MGTDVKLSSEFTIIYGGEVIAYCTDFTLEKNKEIIDITKLGDTWKNKKVDTKDFNVSFNGMITRGDTVTASLWDPTTAYSSGDYVVLAGKAWEAQGSTTGDNPTTDDGTNWLETSAWSSGTTYAAGDMVYITSVDQETRIYKSLQGSNLNQDPLTETAYWERLETNYELLLKELQNNDTEVLCTIKPVNSGETYYYGNGVLTSLSASITQGDKATFSGTFEGSGALTAPEGLGFGAEYQAVYNSFTVPPPASIAQAQNTMVEAIVSAGVWSKLDTFYLFAQYTNDNDEAYVNWIDPGTYDCVENSGIASVFTSLEGVFKGGSAWFLNTGLNPTVAGGNLSQNSASLGIYSRSNFSGYFDLGAADGVIGLVFSCSYSGSIYSKINDATAFNPVNADSRGFYIASRRGATEREIYKNGVSIASDSEVSNGLPNLELYIGKYNGASSPPERQYACAFYGGGLTDTEVSDLTDAVEAYMDSNSKGVIT
jgi:hypothetical protein